MEESDTEAIPSEGEGERAHSTLLQKRCLSVHLHDRNLHKA